MTTLFLLQGNLDYSKKFIEMSLSSAHNSKRADYMAIALIRYGIIFKDKISLDKGLTLVDFLSDPELKSSIQNEIQELEHFL